MQDSITLAQLPYTGFDFGSTYNSLYWVGLLVWSFIIAAIIVSNKDRFAKMFAGLAKVFIIEKKVTPTVQSAEPVILSERIVKFDPLVDPIAARKIRDTESQNLEVELLSNNTQTETQENLVRAIDSITKATEDNTAHDEAAEVQKNRVAEIVDKELAVSRVGQAPDEFGPEDFATVDFDGVNPDDSWKPREKITLPLVKKVEPEPAKEAQAIVPLSKAVVDEIVESPELLEQEAVVIQEQNKVYTDSITLNTESEFPKLVLSREDVTNY